MRKAFLAAVAATFIFGAHSVVANPGLVIFEGWVDGTGELMQDVYGLVDESPCEFPVYVDYEYYETTKAYFDEDGNLTELRFWDRQGYYSFYTDPAISEVVLDEKNTILFGRLDMTTGIVEVTGNGEHLTLPKLGNVFRHTGHWVIDFFAEEWISGTGNQGTWPDGDYSTFCDALAGY